MGTIELHSKLMFNSIKNINNVFKSFTSESKFRRYTWQCLHCQESLLDECEEIHYLNITVKMIADTGSLIYFYFMHP